MSKKKQARKSEIESVPAENAPEEAAGPAPELAAPEEPGKLARAKEAVASAVSNPEQVVESAKEWAQGAAQKVSDTLDKIQGALDTAHDSIGQARTRAAEIAEKVDGTLEKAQSVVNQASATAGQAQQAVAGVSERLGGEGDEDLAPEDRPTRIEDDDQAH